ncbi:MAG: hypothetical protein NT096_06995 [Proteobacteria bacterium]|nr:hypothetical protein [Pseudomonadota bacterium]
MNEGETREPEFPEELIEEIKEEPDKEVFQSLYQKVMEMGVGEKIKLATIGNREARTLLLKDPNRLILSAVVNSPRMTEEDIIKICQSRNVSDEVLRLIAARKELTKNYKVKIGLVSNPKTPVPIALKLLSYISENDLRNISKNKNISTVVARGARKILEDRGKFN